MTTREPQNGADVSFYCSLICQLLIGHQQLDIPEIIQIHHFLPHIVDPQEIPVE